MFSHESKVELVEAAVEAGYLVTLHVVVVPAGGHSVPETKVRERYGRLWLHVAKAIGRVDRVFVYDNTAAVTSFRLIAEFERGALLWSDWPAWAPEGLAALS